ncbi:putative bifunctional diguanylate cyclase/phosphodiesterase [Salinibacillus xinjiangensis]|uniref:EAL domain-containing protein n=1 Tax=Salinibacillus xinjiangensis TaxID=1229268 RepID=A0A6G1X5S2_9BACI|nr:GGDEF domain-containing phosphodiesterase [Salinibacillus xinjiangensis]MRG86287.1 EAL domain-containing protein [Salinibacillus xinjiangensis]
MSNLEKNHMLFNEDEMFQIFTSLFDIVYLMKFEPPNQFRYIKVSESAKKLAMLSDEDIGKTIKEIYHEPMASHLTTYYYDAVSTNATVTFRDRMGIDSEKRFGESVLIPFTYSGESYVVGLTRDITHVVNLEQQQANDPITDLPFVENFMNILESTLRLKKNEGTIWNLYYISINQLSFVQFSNKSTEADLLKQITNRLKRFSENDDQLSRVSGNEFILTIRATQNDDSKKVATQIYEALHQPYRTDDYEVVVQPTIGVSKINPETLDVRGAMTEAFQSMLRAKSKSEQQIYLPFDKKNRHRNTRHDKLERDLAYALQRNELEIYYQPKIDIQKNSLNMEALLRWNHEKFGIIPPNEFIPIAESNQSIKTIGRWVIKQVCQDLKAFQEHDSNVKVAINVSPIQLNDPLFVRDIKQIVLDGKEDPRRIELEITENDLLNLSSAQKQFDALSKEGFSLVLDDFGTSYSSLNYLKELSVQKIKIDKSFIMNMDYHKKDHQIVQMIIKLAKNLDLEVTAEGVEKWRHVEMLTKMDCTEIQGYYISKPIPLQVLLKQIEDNKIMI